MDEKFNESMKIMKGAIMREKGGEAEGVRGAVERVRTEA